METGIDFQKLYDHVDGDEAFVREIVALFIEDMAPKLDQLRTDMKSAQDEQVEKLAHSLKGTAATVCAGRFHETALMLEQAARQKKGLGYPPLVEVLEGEFMKIVQQAQERGMYSPDRVD